MGTHWLEFFWEVPLDRKNKKKEAGVQILCQNSADCSTFGRAITRSSQKAASPKAEVLRVLVYVLSNLLLWLAVADADTRFNLSGTEAWVHWDETLRLLPTEGFVSFVVSSVFTESRDGDGAGTHVYQTRGELESRRTQKTFQCNTNHTHPWDRLQCTMGEGRIQQRRDEPESK